MANKEPSPTSPLIKKPLSIDLTQSASKSAPIPPSPPDQLPTKLIPYFTKSQFAVALIIQGSKPEGLSVKDYCQQLRKSIKPSRLIPNGSHRYVDTHEFWKDQYTKIFEEKKILEDKVLLMEELQRTQHFNPQGNDEVELNQNGKRPALFDEMQELLDTRKENPASADSSMLRLCRYILQIGKQRGQLETTVKKPKSSEYLDNLVRSLDQVLGLMQIALDGCIIPLWALKCTENIRTVRLLQQLMHQMILGFRSCFHALNELCLTILGRSKRYGIVYRLVMFFKKALDHLKAVCTMQAEHEDNDGRKTRSKQIKTDDEYAVNKYLCQALISITQAEWKVGKVGHSDILEGIVFSILDHTGRLVSGAVFNEHVAMSNNPGNITVGIPESLPQSANLEARYIIPILHAVIGRSSSRKELLARILSDHPGNSKDQSHRASIPASERDRHDLFMKARKRLQETLVKQAVGGEELNSLSLPNQPDDVDFSPVPSTCAEKYGPEWLLESVWAVLGWELAI